ncbi:MAG: polysaccharide deacetylase family protein [Acidimicrobiia bacterium]
MTRHLLSLVLASLALIAASIGLAGLIPSGSSHASTSVEVLGRRVTAPSTGAVSPSSSASSVTSTQPAPTSTTSTSTTTTTTTTAATKVPHLQPGPLAQPSPITPVTLSRTTPAIDQVPTTDKVIFLGIDDGLVRDPAVMELLRQERVPLTLFLVRQPALDGKAFFQEMQSVGATIQAHTIAHPQLKKLGYSDQRHQICDQLDDLTNWYGNRPTLFRPPYGEWNETTRSVVAGCKLNALVLWRGATNDGRLDMIGGSFHPGDILLMHFRTDLLQNLKLVFARARAEGYRIGRIEDYLGVGPPHPMFSPPK